MLPSRATQRKQTKMTKQITTEQFENVEQIENKLNSLLVLTENKLDNVQKYAEDKHKRIEKTLNDEIKTSLKVNDSDEMTLNNSTINAKRRSVTAIINSKVAKEELKRAGIDIDALISSTSDLTPEIRGFAKERISVRFKDLAKKTLLSKE